jgi:hypothetical protein
MHRSPIVVNNQAAFRGHWRTDRSKDVDNENGRLLVPIGDACALLGGVGRTTLYELVKRGDLVKANIGRRGFITAKSLEAYVDRLSEAASA